MKPATFARLLRRLRPAHAHVHRPHEMIVELEPRRLLAITITATEGADAAHIYYAGGALHVWINDVERVTTDSVVTIDMLDGIDNVQLESINAPLLNLTVKLGNGADYLTTYDPDRNGGNLAEFRTASMRLDGDGGVDTLGVDDTLGGADTYGASNIGGVEGAVTFRRIGAGAVPQWWRYLDFEQVTIDQGANPATTTLSGKANTSVRLTVNANGGNDTVSVLYGSATFDGWSAGTTTVSGGSGQDRIQFLDYDVNNVSPGGTTVLAGTTLVDGPDGFDYFTFETLAVEMIASSYVNIDNPGGSVTAVEVGNRAGETGGTVNLRAVTQPTTVAAASATVNVGLQDLSTVRGPVSISVPQGLVELRDANANGGNTYRVESGKVTRNPASAAPLVIHYGSPRQLSINAGGGNDVFDVAGVSAATLLASGNFGNDSFLVGGGDLAQVMAAGAQFIGGPGTDSLRFDNAASTVFADAVLTSTTFAANNGRTHQYEFMDSVALVHGSGGSRTEVRSLRVPLDVAGGAGDDVLVIGGGDLGANVAAGATAFFEGGAAEDRLEYDDRLDVNNPQNPGPYTIDVRLVPFLPIPGANLRNDRLTRSGAVVESRSVERRVLHASDDANVINVVEAGPGLRINANGGNDEVNVADAPAHSPVAVHTGDGDDALIVKSGGGGAPDRPAVVLIDQSDEVSALTVNDRGTLRVGPGAVLTKRGGAFAIGGVIDLAGGAMIVQGAAAHSAQFNRYAKVGYNGGAWNGTAAVAPDGTAIGAIHSSLAASTALADGVGVARASDVLGTFPATFAGQPVGATDLLLRHTLAGDANLDRSVDFSDLVRLAQNYDGEMKTWSEGDFNFDAVVDFSDLVFLAQSYDTQLPAPPVAAAVTLSKPPTPTGQVRRPTEAVFNRVTPVQPRVPATAPRRRAV
jgi:hypothetical protein